MSSTFFTTDDGDIILRAGPESGPKHDFRAHKFILALASSVFNDMFTFPQPPDQNQNEEHQLPIVDVPDPPEVLDAILRFIYPGVDLPKFTNLSIVSTLLSAADKYDLASMSPVLRDNLKTFSHHHPFEVYVIACRFGFLEEMREAVMVSTPRSILQQDYEEVTQRVSGVDIYRFVRFVQAREQGGLSRIEDLLEWTHLQDNRGCDHWEDAKDFYCSLSREVGDAFVRNPCVELEDLMMVLNKILDPPLGCEPESYSAEFYAYGGSEAEFGCPLLPATIRGMLNKVAINLGNFNRTLLREVFGEGIGSG